MLKILDYPWHVVHSYRLHGLPAKFTFIDVRRWVWKENQRPLPMNFDGVIEPELVEPGQYDVALLHLDQWCSHRFPIRAMPYRIMRLTAERAGIPQVVIMHGTPDSEENRAEILRLIGDLPVVCNSKQAAREWDGGDDRVSRYGVPQFTPIIHGYDLRDWRGWRSKGRSGIVTVCGGGGYMSYEYHGVPLLERLKRDIPITWVGANGDVPFLESYQAYREFLYRSLIYFSPTRRAPMPGARTEAMLAGCCVVSVPGNDWEEYIDDGYNGFIVSSYIESLKVLSMLLDEPEQARMIGQNGARTARFHFGKTRYARDWLTLLNNMGVLK